MHLLLADDRPAVRAQLRALLEADGSHDLVEAGDGLHAIEIARRTHPAIAVLGSELSLVNSHHGASLVARLSPRTRMLLLVRRPDRRHLIGAFRSGIKGAVLEQRLVDDFLPAVRALLRGGTFFGAGIASSTIRACLDLSRPGSTALTAREEQVLRLIADGQSTKEVARVLAISTKTAESHRTRLMAKLDLHDTASLVRYAIREGFIQP